MRRFTLRGSLGFSSLLVLGLSAFQGGEPLASATANPHAPAAWCAQAQGGPAATQPPLVALSGVHAAQRLFGVGSSFQATDRALAQAMAHHSAGDPAILREYVGAIGDGEECVTQASNAALGPASVEMVGDVAVVHPGTGSISLPAGAKAVAIDVRGLPTVAPDFYDLWVGGVPHDPVRDALDAAVALALAAPVQRPYETPRFHDGYTDGDLEEADYQWSNFIVPFQLEPFPAGSPTDLPLAVLTGKTLAPAAAEMAVALRLAGRAWVFGDDVQTRVAESGWAAIGNQGLMLRYLDIYDPDSFERWPDVVPADAQGGNPVVLTAGLAGLGAPPPVTPGPANRPYIVAVTNTYDPQPDTLGPGEARAGLVSVHGAARYFYGLFDEAGGTTATLDASLVDRMAEVDAAAAASPGPIDRDFYFTTLRRFGVALHDGHNFTFDEAKPFTGHIPLKIEEIGGEPVVRRSGVPGIDAGDAIVGIDGEPASAWYARELALTSAATDRYRFNLVSRKVLLRVYGPRTFDVRSPSGQLRTVVAEPRPYSDEVTFGTAPIDRPSGFLADLGAPDVFYLNMAFEVTPGADQAAAAISAAQGARAMVVDMRGYPRGDHYQTDAMLMPDGFYIPDFGGVEAWAPGQHQLLDLGTFFVESNVYYPGVPHYTGPIILLVGTDTVSAGENFSMMLTNNGRPMHVVGRSTGGTNGEITGIEVLGHFSVSFTGLDVHNADGSRFIGLGIPVDVPVTLTQVNVAGGNDPELNTALGLLLQ